MKTFEVILTTYTAVLMEADDVDDANACMKSRCHNQIKDADSYDLETSEVINPVGNVIRK